MNHFIKFDRIPSARTVATPRRVSAPRFTGRLVDGFCFVLFFAFLSIGEGSFRFFFVLHLNLGSNARGYDDRG